MIASDDGACLCQDGCEYCQPDQTVSRLDAIKKAAREAGWNVNFVDITDQIVKRDCE